MREILFRGKNKDGGKWVEGYVGVFGETTQIFVPFTEEEKEENKDHFFSAINGVWYIVDPETVGQFTGLTDKNGKKIFEGDIVDMHRKGCGFLPIECVEYDEGGFSPIACAGWECTPKHNEIEVIGNIHDNPELLEVKK